MIFIVHLTYLIYKLIENRFIFFFILNIVSFIIKLYLGDSDFSFHISTPNNINSTYDYIIDDYNSDSNGSSSNNNTGYLAYHPGVVQTSQGLRVELDAGQLNRGFIAELDTGQTNLDNHNHPGRGYNDNLSNIPEESSTLLGSVHSSNIQSPRLGEIEPTRSELERSGYYTGNLNNETTDG
jgi:hypothetical protein